MTQTLKEYRDIVIGEDLQTGFTVPEFILKKMRKNMAAEWAAGGGDGSGGDNVGRGGVARREGVEEEEEGEEALGVLMTKWMNSAEMNVDEVAETESDAGVEAPFFNSTTLMTTTTTTTSMTADSLFVTSDVNHRIDPLIEDDDDDDDDNDDDVDDDDDGDGRFSTEAASDVTLPSTAAFADDNNHDAKEEDEDAEEEMEGDLKTAFAFAEDNVAPSLVSLSGKGKLRHGVGRRLSFHGPDDDANNEGDVISTAAIRRANDDDEDHGDDDDGDNDVTSAGVKGLSVGVPTSTIDDTRLRHLLVAEEVEEEIPGFSDVVLRHDQIDDDDLLKAAPVNHVLLGEDHMLLESDHMLVKEDQLLLEDDQVLADEQIVSHSQHLNG